VCVYIYIYLLELFQ